MQLFVYALLKLLYISFLNPIISITMAMPAFLHAPFLGLPAYLRRLFKRSPPAQPFRFLDLPPELRIMVYEHLSDRYWITRAQRHLRKVMMPDNFLYINRQIYGEAMHVLARRMRDAFRIVIEPAGHRDPPSIEFSLYNTSWNIAKVQRIWHPLLHARTIHLWIFWPAHDLMDFSRPDLMFSNNARALNEGMERVCVVALAKMPNLRTIKINFPGGFLHSDQYPPKHRILDLLRPLKLVRRENPGVVVELGEECPISTAELAKQQRYISGVWRHE